ncbi:MAG: hypothetical protein ACREGB_01075 [Candidatus Saccharimonadales bacterium]
MSEQHPIYGLLGKHLKYVREQHQQSLAEVSGAVEVEEQVLERIEAGLERPEEDTLLLLISHFGVQTYEALGLWQLGQYDGEVPEQLQPDIDAFNGSKPVVLMLAFDGRASYSDGIVIDQTKAGLTLNFTQAGQQSQPQTVARVGMSYEQAAEVLQALQRSLLMARHGNQTKLLSPPSSSDSVK